VYHPRDCAGWHYKLVPVAEYAPVSAGVGQRRAAFRRGNEHAKKTRRAKRLTRERERKEEKEEEEDAMRTRKKKAR